MSGWKSEQEAVTGSLCTLIQREREIECHLRSFIDIIPSDSGSL